MLTPLQKRCLVALHRLTQAAGGVCPSFDEIAANLGLHSKSSIHRMLVALEERGLITRLERRQRATMLTHRAYELLGLPVPAPAPVAAPPAPTAPSLPERDALEAHFHTLIRTHGLQAVWQAFERAKSTPAPYEAAHV